MEKLLNLINEYHYANSEACKYLYDDEAKKIYFRTMLEDGDTDEERIDDEWIISKRFGFIEWLVDNNKIDRLTFCTVETPSSKYEDFDLGPETPREDYTNILLMDLAIQDNPIEFLISILK